MPVSRDVGEKKTQHRRNFPCGDTCDPDQQRIYGKGRKEGIIRQKQLDSRATKRSQRRSSALLLLELFGHVGIWVQGGLTAFDIWFYGGSCEGSF